MNAPLVDNCPPRFARSMSTLLLAIASLISITPVTWAQPVPEAGPPVAPADEMAASIDVARLAHPDVARQLQLTDEQSVEVQRMLNARAVALVNATDDTKASIEQNTQQEILQLLSAEQREQLATLASEHKLQFSFANEPWRDVLQWFAKQANMTLVYDQLPDQPFNFRDDREYTTKEAIDLLNGILRSKGYTLIRRNNLLVVASVAQGIPAELIPEVKVTELEKYGQFELVRVLFPIEDRPAESVVQEVQPFIGPLGTIAPLPQTRQVMVTEMAGKIRAIDQLIARIPRPPQPKPQPTPPDPPKPPQPEFQVHSVAGLDVEATAETLKKLVPNATLTFDRDAEQINVFGIPAEQNAVQGAVAQMTANASPENRPTLVVHRIRDVDPTVLAEKIALLAPTAQIVADAEQERVMVFARPADQAKLATALAQLDVTQAEGEEPAVVVHPLRHVDSSAVLTVLQTMFPREQIVAGADERSIVTRATEARQQELKRVIEQIDRPADEENGPLLKTYAVADSIREPLQSVLAVIVPQATLTWEAGHRRLLALGTADDHRQIQQAVIALGDQLPDADEATVEFYPLAPDFQESILQLTTSLVPDAKLTWQAEREQLMVVATAADQQKIDTLIKKLVTNAPPRPAPVLRVYQVRPQLKPRVTAVVTALYSSEKDFRIIEETQPGELSVMATDDQHQRLQQTLTQLEQADESRAQLVLKAYPVQHVEIDGLVALMAELFPQTKIMADEGATRLLVWATSESQQDVERALQQLDVADASSDKQELASYDLPTPISQTLIASLTEKYPKMVLRADPATGRLIAWGTPADQQKLREAVEQWRRAVAPQGKTLHVYPAGGMVPTVVQSLVQGLAPGAQVFPHSDGEHVLVLASDAEHAQLGDVLARHSTVEVGPNVRVYPLATDQLLAARELVAVIAPRATARNVTRPSGLLVVAATTDHERIATALDQLTSTLPSGEKRVLKAYTTSRRRSDELRELMDAMEPEARFFEDASRRRVLALATEAEHERLGQLADQFGLEALSRTTKVYRPDGAQLSTVQTALEAVAPDADVATDRAQRTIVVTATAEEHARIDEVLQSLANVPAVDPIARHYRLPSSSGRLVLTTLRRLYDDRNDVTVSIDDAGDHLVAVALPADQRRIEEVVESFRREDAQAAEAARTVRVYPLGDVSVSTVQEALENEAAPNVHVTVDSERNSLIVTAATDEHERMSALVRDLVAQLPPKQTMSSRVFPLAHASTSVTASALEALLPNAQVAADRRTRSVVVTAAPEDLLRAEQVVRSIDGSRQDEFEPQSYSLDVPDAESAYEAITRLVDEDLGARFSFDPAQKKMFVVAGPEQHKLIAAAVEKVAAGDLEELQGQLAVYSLDDVDGESLQATLSALFADDQPEPHIELDESNHQLVVVATADQHGSIKKTLELVRRPVRSTSLFQITRNDPSAVRRAAEQLFEHLPIAASPQIELNEETAELLVRGNDQQLKDVRELLQQLGESVTSNSTGSGLRVVRLYGDVDKTMSQLQSLWPSVRPNRLQIIYPGDRGEQAAPPVPPGSRSKPPLGKESEADSLSLPDETSAACGGPSNDGELSDDDEASVADSDELASEPAAPYAARTAAELPPIVVVPSAGKVTIASGDVEAVQALEGLLRVLSPPIRYGGSDVAVYGLRHANALDIVDIARRLFNREQSFTSDQVVMAADTRLNSVVVLANARAQDMVQSLIQVLDSESELAEWQVSKPRVLPIEFASVDHVMEILEDVYESQLTTGGGRKKVDIPEGISSDVAQVLQEINAATSGPLLTLSVDKLTNSIIALGPPRLLDEVADLIAEVDQGAETGSTTGMRLVPLRSMRSTELQELLDRLLSG